MSDYAGEDTGPDPGLTGGGLAPPAVGGFEGFEPPGAITTVSGAGSDGGAATNNGPDPAGCSGREATRLLSGPPSAVMKPSMEPTKARPVTGSMAGCATTSPGTSAHHTI